MWTMVVCSISLVAILKEKTGLRLVRKATETGRVTSIFEGIPPDNKPEEYIAVPVKKGGLVLIHGEVVHKITPRNLVMCTPSIFMMLLELLAVPRTGYKLKNHYQHCTKVIHCCMFH